MADVNRGNRPLSPHMTIYRWPVTAITSILTRITGNALLVGGLLAVWWFVAAASGPDAYAVADAVITSWFGKLVLLGSIWAIWYHTLAGLRHLVWDAVYLLDVAVAEKLSWGVIAGSLVLTVITVAVL